MSRYQKNLSVAALDRGCDLKEKMPELHSNSRDLMLHNSGDTAFMSVVVRQPNSLEEMDCEPRMSGMLIKNSSDFCN